ncbi:MAG: hypothetical protein IPL35_13640 [Sphingobacteriales bacterium]|nr:hypothetical protein [Sphingobacteriales bacterium]
MGIFLFSFVECKNTQEEGDSPKTLTTESSEEPIKMCTQLFIPPPGGGEAVLSSLPPLADTVTLPVLNKKIDLSVKGNKLKQIYPDLAIDEKRKYKVILKDVDTLEIAAKDSIIFAVALKGYFWQKDTLKVKFLDGSASLQAKVISAANQWSKYANIF